jgi:hypothetical protein
MYGVTLPELAHTETLHRVWQDIGMAQSGMSGAVPISWQELRAFAEMTGRDIRLYEAQCLVDMSRGYCAEISNRTSCIAPMERKRD